MFRKSTPAILFSAMIALASCKANVLVDAYVSDMFLAENVVSPAQVEFGIPCSSQAEYEDKIISLFNNTSNAKIVGCEQKGMDSFLVVQIDAVIATETSNHDLALVRHQVDDIEHDGIIYEARAVQLLLSEDFLQNLHAMAKENFFTLPYVDIKFKVALNNDERKHALVTGYHLWVNGQPYEVYRNQLLARRQKINITFSNLTSALLMEGKMPTAFLVGRPKQA